MIFGLGLLIGSLIPVSHPEQIARQSVTPLYGTGRGRGQWSLVGRIAGHGRLPSSKRSKSRSRDRPETAPDSRLLGDKFALVSGLMEITYDTGARSYYKGR